jgi:hypothetical protein
MAEPLLVPALPSCAKMDDLDNRVRLCQPRVKWLKNRPIGNPTELGSDGAI